jgi:hypothetical protein
MSLNDVIVRNLRRNTLRELKRLSGRKEASHCLFYPATNTLTNAPIVKRNLYHDVVDDTGPAVITGIPTVTYIDIMPPIKVVKEAGWWKEGDTLPIVAYIGYEGGVVPEKGAKLEVTDAGYMKGMYVIQNVKMYGKDSPIVYMCTITADRDSKVNV